MKRRNLLSGTSRVRAPVLEGARVWLDSEPLEPADLHGHVIAYDFWTYTCVNWLRMLPYLRAWDDRYRHHGLIVIGIHTPEFSFEQMPDNVRSAVRVRRIHYPVVIDNGYASCQVSANPSGPLLYLGKANAFFGFPSSAR